MGDRMRWLVTGAVALAVLAPAVLPGGSDGFPLSTYPMFTSDRGQVVDLATVVLVEDGERSRLSPALIGGTDEIVHASATIGNAIEAGPDALGRLCREVAGRVDRAGTVEIATERHDTVALLRDDAPPLRITVHARCEAAP